MVKNNSFPDQIKLLKEEFSALLQSKQASASQLIKDRRFKDLSKDLLKLPVDQRPAAGKAINSLKDFLEQAKKAESSESSLSFVDYLDPTAPAGINRAQADLPALEQGSRHPIYIAQDELLDIFLKMGFSAVESRQLDSEYYMFDSLNFPAEHPARDEFDTFWLKDKDARGRPLLAPAHTSTMQHRLLKDRASNLDNCQPIAAVVPGRVFRNEDVDMSHDHMFYQLEGIYVSYDVTVTNLIATLKEAMSAYFKQDLKLKIQPFYFPFTEPSFEFAISCPFCLTKDSSTCSTCSAGFIELLGCGMIHPNVLDMAHIDSRKFNGFAFGIGLNRLAMIRYGIEDIRHFTSGNLDFLRQFRYEN